MALQNHSILVIYSKEEIEIENYTNGDRKYWALGLIIFH